MIHVFLYDADGHDQEVDLDAQCISQLGERSLLWVDVEGRDRDEMETLAALFSLDRGSLRELLNPQEALYLDNYGDYFQFDVVGLATDDEGDGERTVTKRRPVQMEFLVGPRW